MKQLLSRLLVTVASTHLGRQAAPYDQCEDPLFQTHWAGKNDIPTLTSIPTVQTNLLKCKAYNERASCCHQGFETEQDKYYEFWKKTLKAKFQRANAHRLAVVAAEQTALQNGAASRIDLEQMEVVKKRYVDVLSPSTQAGCFSNVLTYVAGMMCFGCKPDWFQYTVMSGDHVMRVRLARSVCLKLWASCAAFAESVSKLRVAIQDSRIARSASRSEESLDMFLNQERLCEWAHDEIALRPFRLPSKEDQDLATQTAVLSTQRRLNLQELELDVLAEGRATTFARTWHGASIASKAYARSALTGFVIVACSLYC